jgi:hypothetical protein
MARHSHTGPNFAKFGFKSNQKDTIYCYFRTDKMPCRQLSLTRPTRRPRVGRQLGIQCGRAWQRFKTPFEFCPIFDAFWPTAKWWHLRAFVAFTRWRFRGQTDSYVRRDKQKSSLGKIKLATCEKCLDCKGLRRPPPTTGPKSGNLKMK